MTVAYLNYIVLAILVTIGVGHSLHRLGRPFLLEVFRHWAELADSLNHLLLVGFYLTNLALATFMLRSEQSAAGALGAVELVATKLGIVMIILAGMHLVNVFLLVGVRR